MVKKLLFLSLVIFGCLPASAQVGYNEINVNSIKTGMHANGVMFMKEDFEGANFIVPYNDDSREISTIFQSGMWISAKNKSGNITVAIPTPNSNVNIVAGPIYDGVISENYNRVWKVTKDEINAHLEGLSDGSIDNPIPSGIKEWPSSDGNDLLPFHDHNGDGIYNPEYGDYPILGDDMRGVIPSELLYAVFSSKYAVLNDVLNVEIHAFMYAFDCENHPELHNTIFTRHMIRSKEKEELTDFRVGYFQDANLGCFEDDFVGCDTTLNMMFVYNRDTIDGDAEGNCHFGIPSFGNNPPVQSSKFLNQKMDAYVAFYNPSVGNPPVFATYPKKPSDFHNLLGGTYKDGSKITIGGIGYDSTSTNYTKHSFHDDPNDPNGWSMYASDISVLDQATAASTHKDRFLPGEIMIIDMAHTYTNDPSLNHVETVTAAKMGARIIQDLYDGKFSNSCTTSSTKAHTVYNIEVYPNPSSGNLSIAQKGDFTDYVLTNNVGKIVAEGRLSETKTNVSLDLASGVYHLKLTNKANGNHHVEALVIE